MKGGHGVTSGLDTSDWPDELRRFAANSASAPPTPDLEGLDSDTAKARLEIWKVSVDLWKLQLSGTIDSAKMVAEFSKIAIGQVLTVNAGAAVAILALFGNLVSRSPNDARGWVGVVSPALLA